MISLFKFCVNEYLSSGNYNSNTRKRANQHKCLPLHVFINPTPLLSLKIVVNSKNDSKIKTKFPLVYRACRDESIDIHHITL